MKASCCVNEEFGMDVSVCLWRRKAGDVTFSVTDTPYFKQPSFQKTTILLLNLGFMDLQITIQGVYNRTKKADVKYSEK
jgi:hypothetical protein